nr:hypothetical protein [Tanacetum cinerariifolium]
EVSDPRGERYGLGSFIGRAQILIDGEGVVWASLAGSEGPSHEPIPIPSNPTLWDPSPSSCESTMFLLSSSSSRLGC